jgi:hypothetical protein
MENPNKKIEKLFIFKKPQTSENSLKRKTVRTKKRKKYAAKKYKRDPCLRRLSRRKKKEYTKIKNKSLVINKLDTN